MILSSARFHPLRPAHQVSLPAPAAWERPLIDLAQAGLNAGAGASHQSSARPATLDQAYHYCSELTARHSRSFHLASALLPGDKRRAMRALYAFCRVADDIVDQAVGGCPGGTAGSQPVDARAALAAWRQASLESGPAGDDLVALAWDDTRQRYHIPVRYAEQLLEGVARDLCPTRYATFADLAVYAYGVASTVGLMSMHITGFSGRQAIPYAVKLGVALQITNILRDVGEDLQAGRVYLPADELAWFGLSEADLQAGRVDERWRRFMRFQIERNRRLYAEAWPGIALLHPDGRLAVGAAADFYAAILDDIEAHDYDVFSRRAHIGAGDKLRRLPGLWWRVHRIEKFMHSPTGWRRAARSAAPAGEKAW